MTNMPVNRPYFYFEGYSVPRFLIQGSAKFLWGEETSYAQSKVLEAGFEHSGASKA